MEERKELMVSYVGKGLSVAKACEIAGVTKSSFYYRSNGKKKGKKPSEITFLREGGSVSNAEVISRIESLLFTSDFIDYGYQRVHQALRKQGLQINHKKVYRLMKESNLLFPSKKNQSRAREFVKYTVPLYSEPFATIEIDIKYVYIVGERRHAYLATVLDTFSRLAIEWEIGWQMKSSNIVALIKRFLSNSFVKPYLSRIVLKIRTDNGPQFISIELGKEINLLQLEQEFIRPGTPQQNGHIESFHHTLKKLVTDKFQFNSLEGAREVLCGFYRVYNNDRIMKSILYCSPIEFIQRWETGQIGIKEENQKQIFFFREGQSRL